MKKSGEHNLAKKGFCVAFGTLACIMVTLLNGCFDSDIEIVLNSNGSGVISSKTRFAMLDKTTTNWFAQSSLVTGRYEGVTVQAQLIEETNRMAAQPDSFDRMAGVSQTVSFASLSDLGGFAKSHPAAASFSLTAVTDGVWRLAVPALPYIGGSTSNFAGSSRYLVEEGRSETGDVMFIDHAYPFSLMHAVCSQAVSRLRVTLPGDILDSNGATDSVRTCSWDDQLGKMTCEELSSFFRNDRWVTFQWSNALARVGSEAAQREILLPRPPGQKVKETTATIKAVLDGASVRFTRPVSTNGTMEVSWTIACELPADTTVLNMLSGNVAITTTNGETRNLKPQEWGQSTTAGHRSFIWRVSCELPEVDDPRIRQLSGTFDIYYVRNDASVRRISLDAPGTFVLGWDAANAPCLTRIGEAPRNVKYLVRGHSDALPFVQDESAREFPAGRKSAAWDRPDELFNIGWMLKSRGDTVPATLAVYENVCHEQVSFAFEDAPVP